MSGMKTHTDPKVDYAFKHVFGREQSKPALMSLLDAVLQPAAGQNIASIELLNPFNEKEALDDKLSILDIKARDQSGRQFNVEMQMLAYGAFASARSTTGRDCTRGNCKKGMTTLCYGPRLRSASSRRRSFRRLPTTT